MVNPSGEYNDPLSPYTINEALANEARHFSTDDVDKFLHPRDMSEVMKALEREGVDENVIGKKNIKSRFGLRRLELASTEF